MKSTLILWKHSKKKDGTHPIKIRIQDGATKQVYKNTGVSIHEMFWKGGKVVKHPEANKINKQLKDILEQVEVNYQNRGVAVSGDSESLYWWFDRRIRYSEAKHSYYHVRKQITVRNKLMEFRPEIKVKHINKILAQDLETWLLNDGRDPGYIKDIFVRTKVVVDEIIDSGIPIINPFRKYKITVKKKEKVRLSLKDIEMLAAIKPVNASALLARDLYLFSFYCAGIRFGDLCRLKHDMVKNGRLAYTMHKSIHTGNPKIRNIKLRPEALKIIKRQKTAGYIFDTGVDWNDGTDGEKSISDRNAFFNKKLKAVCKLAKVQNISFHTTRNSFTDIAVSKKVDTHRLKELLGHSKLATTEIYMKEYYREETDEAMDQVFGA